MSESQIDIAKIMTRAGNYAPGSYWFIRDGLAHAAELVHGSTSSGIDENRHITGQQLCLGLRDFAIRRYGLLAKPVLNKWGIYETRDFGNIIFALVDAELMRTTEEDCIEDFENVYEFDEVFETPIGDAPEPALG